MRFPQAKVYTENKRQSLSELIENDLKIFLTKGFSKDDWSSKIKSLPGLAKMLKDFNRKKILEEEIMLIFWIKYFFPDIPVVMDFFN